MINSEFLNGLDIHEATQKIMDYFEEKGWGKRTVTYRLRDWCISRQRYWGPPIPMIYCPTCAKKGQSWFTTGEVKNTPGVKSADTPGVDYDPSKKHLGGVRRTPARWKVRVEKLAQQMPGWYPEDEENLPLELPFIKNYQPEGKGKSPLAEEKSFYEVKCPFCGQAARRETDVSDTFLDSAWYFLRYPSTEFADKLFDQKRTKKWLPVNMYIGGNEHACLHLLYSRFVTMALHDLGYLDFQEPFQRFFAHGLIIKDGAKMSKSRGNVINPEEYMDEYGADALRMYLLFLGPISQGGDFRDTGMRGMRRFLKRLYQLAAQSANSSMDSPRKKHPGGGEATASAPAGWRAREMSPTLTKKLHQTIKKVGEDLEKLRFNTAIAAIMELVNVRQKEKGSANKELVGAVARLLAPFAPHLAEEFWEIAKPNKISNTKNQKFASVLDAGWPKYDPELTKEDKVTIVIQVNGKLRDSFKVDSKVANFGSRQDKGAVLKLVQKSAKIQRHLKGKKIKKTVFVPGRLVNLAAQKDGLDCESKVDL